MGAAIQIADDMGFRVELAHPPARIVSLVPSWTETLFALGFDSEIVGVTKFCVEPAASVASIAKVGGTKNPDVRAILNLEPELVIANAEEGPLSEIDRAALAEPPVFLSVNVSRLDPPLKIDPKLNDDGLKASLGVWTICRGAPARGVPAGLQRNSGSL